MVKQTALEEMWSRYRALEKRWHQLDPDNATEADEWQDVDDQMVECLSWLRHHDPQMIANEAADLYAQLADI